MERRDRPRPLDLPDPIAAFTRAVKGPAEPGDSFWVRIVRQDRVRRERLHRLTTFPDMTSVWRTLKTAPLRACYERRDRLAFRSSLMVDCFLPVALSPSIPSDLPLGDQNKRLKKIAAVARALHELLVEPERVYTAFDVSTDRDVSVTVTNQFSTSTVLPGLNAALHALSDAAVREKLLTLQAESLLSHSHRPADTLPYLDLIDAAMIFAPLEERLLPLAALADVAQTTPRSKPPKRESAPLIAFVRALADFFQRYYAAQHYAAIAYTVNAALDLADGQLDSNRVRQLIVTR